MTRTDQPCLDRGNRSLHNRGDQLIDSEWRSGKQSWTWVKSEWDSGRGYSTAGDGSQIGDLADALLGIGPPTGSRTLTRASLLG